MVGCGSPVTCAASGSAFQEYLENLSFRRRKRDYEYSHQPLSWSCGSLAGPSGLHDVRLIPSSGDRPPDGCDPGPRTVDCCTATEEPPPEQSTDFSRLEAGTQTSRPLVSRNPFAPYAIGSTDSTSSKRTFNVKSNCGVYPSAFRADVRRRQRLTRSNDRALLEYDLSSGKQNRPDVLSNLFHVCRSSSENPHLNENNPTKGNICCSGVNFRPSADSHWVSEYHSEFPVYPSSVYARSASKLAGRCRPLSALESHAHIKRSGGSLNSHEASRRKAGSAQSISIAKCPMPNGIPNSHRITQILSAR